MGKVHSYSERQENVQYWVAMTVLPEMIPVSDLRQDAAATLKRLEYSRDPIVITQREQAAAVRMSIKSYERSEKERQLLLRLLKAENKIQTR
ncbi:MAG: prevent-host-death family protein [Magnetococcales bacterium]|nr:prevent-host-death family protein [Magnetococcales bacterium]